MGGEVRCRGLEFHFHYYPCYHPTVCPLSKSSRPDSFLMRIGAVFCFLSFMNALEKTPISPFVATGIHKPASQRQNFFRLVFNEQMAHLLILNSSFFNKKGCPSKHVLIYAIKTALSRAGKRFLKFFSKKCRTEPLGAVGFTPKLKLRCYTPRKYTIPRRSALPARQTGCTLSSKEGVVSVRPFMDGETLNLKFTDADGRAWQA